MLVRLSAPHGAVAGVDIGHGHVRVAVADRTGTVLAEEKVDLDVDDHGATTLDRAAAMVRSGLATAGFEPHDLHSIGMCVPAPLDRRSARVGSGVMPGWADLAPGEELAGRLGAAVHADNDANLGALAEIGHGGARGVGDLVYVKVASGLGAGLVLDGRLYRGRHGLAARSGTSGSPTSPTPCAAGAAGGAAWRPW